MAPGGKALDLGVDIGQVFLGKYRVDSILGHGGMGVVAECTHLQLGERVAIKMLRKDVLLDEDAVQRFTREAQAAAKLKSEYVAKVTDVGRFENNVPYMVMEFLEGHDLGQLLEQRGVLPVPWASELMMQTAEALAEAHSLGIVHRDVKPTNLFVTWRPDGSALVKVLDFGISKSPMGTDMQLTQTQSLLGTPAYMSPEQMRSARLVDSRSDIWSLGTVFYELLEGRRPFEAESFSEMCVKVAVDAPAPMVNTPPALQQVILRCLAKSPEQRYTTMADLGRDLIPFVQDTHQAQKLVERMQRMLRRSVHNWDSDQSGVLGRSSQVDSAPVRQWSAGSDPVVAPYVAPSDRSAPVMRQDPSQPVAATATSTMMTAQRPRRGLWAVITVGLLAGVGIALAVGMNRGDEPRPTAPPATASQAPAKAPDPKPELAAKPLANDGPGSAAAVAVTKPEPKPDQKPDQRPDPIDVAKPKPGGSTGAKKPPIKKGTPAIKKDDPQPETKLPEVKPPEVKDATVKPVTPTAKCDPFGSMHGCDANGPSK